jgi:hypothetical protein
MPKSEGTNEDAGQETVSAAQAWRPPEESWSSRTADAASLARRPFLQASSCTGALRQAGRSNHRATDAIRRERVDTALQRRRGRTTVIAARVRCAATRS